MDKPERTKLARICHHFVATIKKARKIRAANALKLLVKSWLRGRDLNPRPSGYECFYLVAVNALMFLLMLICADLFRSSMGDRFA